MRTQKQIAKELIRLRAIIDNYDVLASEVAYIAECAIQWTQGYSGSPTSEIDIFVSNIERHFKK